MNRPIVRLLARFKAEDLRYIVSEWTSLHSSPRWNEETEKKFYEIINKRDGKKVFASTVVRLMAKHLNYSHQAELDLLYVLRYPMSKNWITLKLNAIPGESFNHSFTPEELEKKLSQELADYCYHAMVHVRMQPDGALYSCVHIDTDSGVAASGASRGYNSSNTTFIVNYPRTNYMCVAGGKIRHRARIQQAFIRVYNCESIEPADLEGRCVRSLLQIALHRNTPPGSMSSDALANCYRLPLVTNARKRKQPELSSNEDSDEEDDDRVTCENAEERQACLKYIREKFGDGPLPKLERLDYNLTTNFRHAGRIPNMPGDVPFRCTVTFRGSNVLEGLRKLVSTDVAPIPMKAHVCSVQALGRNKFTLRSKSAV